MLLSTAGAIAPRPTAALERRRRWERGHRARLVATDAALVVVAAGTSLAAQVIASGSAHVVPVLILPTAALVLLWLLLLSGLRTREAEVLGSGIAEYRRVAHAGGLALGVFAVVGILLDWSGMRVLLFAVGPVTLCGILLARWLWRKWLRRERLSGRYVSRTLVAGFEDDVRHVIRSLDHGGENGFHVVAATLFPEEPGEPEESGERRLSVGETEVPVHGTMSTVAATAERLAADRIVIASRPPGSPDFVRRLSWQLEGTASEVVLSHSITDVVGPRMSFQPVDGLPLLRIKIPSYEGGQHLLKRLLDVCVASLALVLIALALPFIALLIKLDSPGPVFYHQERLGRDGRGFKMVKFRSMHVDAEAELEALREQNEGAGPLFKMRHDPRITRVGRVLRKLSLDELPQFWNVLVGDMSVVGPRPPLPVEAMSYDGVVTRRLYIKPGITGLWQVSGRSDLSWDESVRLDLRYVENWSLMQDMQIMWRTAKVMIQPKGAY